MPVKVCFDNEIHRFSKLHPSLESFTSYIASSFKTQLPQFWALSSINSEGVNVLLSNESDYQNLCENYSRDNSVTIRLYIVAIDPNMTTPGDENKEKVPELEQPQSVQEAKLNNILNKADPIIELSSKEQPAEKTEAATTSEVQDAKQEQAISNEDLISQNKGEKTLETNENAALEQKQNEVKPQADPQPKKEEDKLDQLKKMVEKLILGKFSEDKVEVAKMKIKKLEATLTEEQKEELTKKREQVEKALLEKKAKQEKAAAAKLLQKQKQIKAEAKTEEVPSESALVKPQEETKQSENIVLEQKTQGAASQPVVKKAPAKSQMKCAGCNNLLTSGAAYKCSQCADFNFCEACEATKEHPHLFLKIKDVGLFAKNNAKAATKVECPYAAFQKLVEDLKKGNLEQVQKCCSKYLTKLSEEARNTLNSLFESIPEENKEKIKDALIQLKEKAFGKDNCSCVEEREKLKEAQRLFKEEKVVFANAQKGAKLKLKEEINAFKTTKKVETEKLKAEWQKLKEKKKEDAEKLKEEWKKLKEKVAADKKDEAKKKVVAAKPSVVKEEKAPESGKKESVLAEAVEKENLVL